jgi:hypothetical protein
MMEPVQSWSHQGKAQVMPRVTLRLCQTMRQLRLSKVAHSEVDVLLTLKNLFLIVALLLTSTATGEEPCAAAGSLLPKCSLVCPDFLLRGCCCIYCPKPMPCVLCARCCCPDDYCCKPCPCIPCYHGGVCNCYCCKPCPALCRKIAADYYTCEAGSACTDCAPAFRVSQSEPAKGTPHSAGDRADNFPPKNESDETQLPE